MNTYTILVVVIAAVVVVVGVFFFASSRQDGRVTENSAAKSGVAGSDLERLSRIALTDYEGARVSLAEYRGKPLVVNAWAVWCPFCRKELPDFAALQGEFPDIVVIAIDRRESVETARSYTDELGITERMVFLLDSGDNFYREIGGFSMPETIFMDTKGIIVFHKRGPLTLEEMRAAVNQYLR